MLFIWSISFLFPLMVSFISLFLLLSGTSESILFSVFVEGLSFEMFLVIDFISLIFSVVVGLVSFSVLLYSLSYMSDSKFKKKFMIIMTLFISSMLILVYSGDLFWLMVGWDGLGISSFFLIIFFQNWKSFNSGMVTFLSNRLGDSLIIISMVWFLGFGLSKSISEIWMGIFVYFLIAGAISKSAQIPFSAWLPLAMAAPTPVSSLVHSSTLVTAGVYLLIRFNSLLSKEALLVVGIISSVTIFLAASSSLGEFDLKKIIALSTLSHVGMMMFFISIGSCFSAMFHLLTHAMFKSLLFMISGDLIHSNKNWQDIRILSINSLNFPTGVSMVVSLSSMVGLPFFSGFYSKEIFLNSSLFSAFSLITFSIAAMLTSSYSIRIIFSLLKGKSVEIIYEVDGSWKIFFFMSMMSVLGGSTFIFLFKSWEDFDVFPLFHSFFLSKKEIFAVIFAGVVLSVLVLNNQDIWKTSWLHNMWWISSSNIFAQKSSMITSYFLLAKSDSKGMLDSTFHSLEWSANKLSKSSLNHFVYYPMMGISLLFLTSVFCNLLI